MRCAGKSLGEEPRTSSARKIKNVDCGSLSRARFASDDGGRALSYQFAVKSQILFHHAVSIQRKPRVMVSAVSVFQAQRRVITQACYGRFELGGIVLAKIQ